MMETPTIERTVMSALNVGTRAGFVKYYFDSKKLKGPF